MGFTGYLQTWFRYFLQMWIESSLSQIEAKEGMYSLDFHRDVEGAGAGFCQDSFIPRLDSHGRWWQKNSINLSQMTLEWGDRGFSIDGGS